MFGRSFVYDAHNALSDAITLQQLAVTFISEATQLKLLKSSWSLNYQIERFYHLKRLATLSTLNGIIGKTATNKIAASGFDFDNLKLVYLQLGEIGVKNLIVFGIDGN